MKLDCLIVDDEIALAETTCEYFNMFEVKTAFVTSAEECEHFLKEHERSVLLLDINLGNKRLNKTIVGDSELLDF